MSEKQDNARKNNLIPFGKRSVEEERRMRSKGGSANKNNPKSLLAVRIREIKKRGMTDERKRKLYEIMTNPDISVLDIREKLEEIKDQMDAKDLIKTFIDIHKIHHGTKVRSENLNINVNVNQTIESAYERRKKEMEK